MSDKQDETIDGARRTGVTLLHSFADRAELDVARSMRKSGMSSIGLGYEATTKFGRRKMGNLFVVGFDEPNQAEKVHLKLLKLQSEGLLDLADAAVAVKDERGKVKLDHPGNVSAEGSVFLDLCGSLTNFVLRNATASTASGALADVGITDRFMKELATVLMPSRSALFILTSRPTSDKDRVRKSSRDWAAKFS